ncbi:MAG: hypothetical protein OXJ52_08020 [Oligoflexia bacterium]|nr:hypothetical protein [Oligoflexia bacterium]
MKEENTNPSFPIPKDDTKTIIEAFLSDSNKLSILDVEREYNKITLFQNYDRKTLSFDLEDVKKVLERKDYKGQNFLQVNFKDGKKILLTHDFVGFSPAVGVGIDVYKLPKVVTTADILSVIEAIESSIYGTDQYQESLYEAKMFFESIAAGAESIGFDLTGERLWVEKLLPKTTLAN